jgi:hypothetical protein
MMKKFLVLIVLLGIAGAARPQKMLPVWVKSIGGPEWDIANTICVTPSGEVVVSGTFTDLIYINGKSYYSNGFTDVFVAKYNSKGFLINAFTFGGTGCDVSRLSTYENNVVLLSKFQRPFELQGTRVDSTGRANYMITWFDDRGKLQSIQTISSNDELEITDLETNKKGTVYLTGWFKNRMKIGNETFMGMAGENAFIATLTQKGKINSLQKLASSGQSRFYACTLDENNQLYAAGISSGPADRDVLNPAIQYNNLFTVSLNSEGKISDIQTLIKGIYLIPKSIVEKNDQLWVVSQFKYYCIKGVDTIKAKGQEDILMINQTVKSKKNNFWTIGGYAKDLPLSLTPTGNQILLSGSYSDTIWFGNEILVSNRRGSDVFMATFDVGTTPVDKISFGGTNNDFPMAVTSSGAEIYVLGQFKNSFKLGNNEVISEGSYDVFVSRFENFGALPPVPVPLWIGGVILLLAGCTLLVKKISS